MGPEKKNRDGLIKPYGITKITVGGYKSIAGKNEIEIKPLTVLAGANSSGKSSMMQPLLLLKQTLEAGFDPGPLLLYGPNLKFTEASQLLSVNPPENYKDVFSVGFTVEDKYGLEVFYKKRGEKRGFMVNKMVLEVDGKKYIFRENMRAKTIEKNIWPLFRKSHKFAVELYSWLDERMRKDVPEGEKPPFSLKDLLSLPLKYRIMRDKCFLTLFLCKRSPDKPGKVSYNSLRLPFDFEFNINNIIHVPGLRGNPLRAFDVSATGPDFPGTFEKYTASIIREWQDADSPKLVSLNEDLKDLGLTYSVSAGRVDDARVELKVKRLTNSIKKYSKDEVNIVDVGFGVSQGLPVLVAINAAERGHLIYLEQPEIHLHPRAKYILARIIAKAIRRGVKVIVETHSLMLLLGIQTAVAQGPKVLPNELVKIHWFKRDVRDGMTEIQSTDLDGSGAFINPPDDEDYDFDLVLLKAQKEYLDAA